MVVMSLVAHASSASSSSSSSVHLHPHRRDALWQMSMLSREQVESGHYPVREDEPDCSYYIRTGFCRFGATCRFNHPLNRNLAMATARMRGEYPERIGQPECQNEVDCVFYMRNGHCKFGVTCKFNHPQPSNMMVSLHGSALYPPVHSATTSAQPVPGVSFIPGPQWQSPSSCAQLIMPQGVLSVPWNTYGQVSSVSPSKNQQQTEGNSEKDVMSCQAEGTNMGLQFGSNPLPVGTYAFERGNLVFPERPGLPECQFYLKTGNCKFGPGEPKCVYYSQYGVCKFGPSCKFDHPMRAAAASSSTGSPDVHPFMPSSSGTVALSSSSDGLVEESSTNSRQLSSAEARQKPSDDNTLNNTE
ncbi:zinc finger CCCH domain-containing protein zfn-like [Phtheirospermum japonicum]|uniref:Zinc finger CCCH domain-containing protein zfn-like n=1 Tax=Phtheirospermum japonicum TaxID=374723 RepID=A0A830CN43_9LAMI|nr:zinc finger CCCH domain-containing protein zfn-like [Phtheirospermum japonicum]